MSSCVSAVLPGFRYAPETVSEVLRVVTQDAAEDFAGRQFRQFIAELELAGHLEGGEVGAAIGGQFVRRRALPALEGDEGLLPFSPL